MTWGGPRLRHMCARLQCGVLRCCVCGYTEEHPMETPPPPLSLCRSVRTGWTTRSGSGHKPRSLLLHKEERGLYPRPGLLPLVTNQEGGGGAAASEGPLQQELSSKYYYPASQATKRSLLFFSSPLPFLSFLC